MKRFFISTILSYLRFFARKALTNHKPTIIGIAGSVGKSSTRNAIEAILKDHFPTKSIGNSETGIPLGILGMKPENYSKLDWLTMLIKAPLNTNFLQGTKYLVAEMGIDEPYPPKNMEYLLTILKPDIAVSLNVSATHSMQFDRTVHDENLSARERLEKIVTNIAKEDTKIITESGCSVGIYNADDEHIVRSITDRTTPDTKLVTFGTKSTNDISYSDYKVSIEGSSFKFSILHQDKRHEATVRFPTFILPRGYQEVLAAAILVGLQGGLTLDQIVASLEKNYELPKGRASFFDGIKQTKIIDSTYNASKSSTFAFLDLVDALKKDSGRKVAFLFGDMRELGKESQLEHEEVAKKLIGIVDYLYLVGPQTREYVLPIIQEHEAKFKEMRWFDNSVRAGEYLKDNLTEKAIILAKGSQNTIFLEEAVKRILADKNDTTKLCRQEKFWLDRKTQA